MVIKWFYYFYTVLFLLHMQCHFIKTTRLRYHRSLRIAQVAPMFEGLPPTRSVTADIASRSVQYLTDELVKRGHDVTLFGPYGATTSAKLVCHPNLTPINRNENQAKTLLPYVWQIEQVRHRADDFDVIHFHTIEHMNSIDTFMNKTVTTLYLSKYNMLEMAPLFDLFHDVPFVALTIDQKKHAPYRPKFVGQIYPGIPATLHTFVPTQDADNKTSLAFLGRMEPEKGHEQAIQIALEAGIPLKIGTGQQSKEMEKFYEQQIKPLVEKHANLIEYWGEIKAKDKKEFLGNALALLVLPKDEDDPLELAMIEAMAMGTPVVGLRDGPITEVVEPRMTGLVFGTVSEGAKIVKNVAQISRIGVRKAFEKRWTIQKMVDSYEQIYQQIFDRNVMKARTADDKQCKKNG